FHVIDHGDGIPDQLKEQIFNRFWRADSSRNRDTGGTGLGLAIVESIVAAHHGHVRVSDTPGGGATFEIYLPLVVSKPPADEVESEPDADASGEADSSAERAAKPRAKGKTKAKARAKTKGEKRGATKGRRTRAKG